MADCNRTDIFFKELKRMCASHKGRCSKCALALTADKNKFDTCNDFVIANWNIVKNIVQEWSAAEE